MPKQETAEMQKGGPAEVSAFGLDKEPQTQQAAIADGADATVNAILAVLRTYGLIAE